MYNFERLSNGKKRCEVTCLSFSDVFQWITSTTKKTIWRLRVWASL